MIEENIHANRRKIFTGRVVFLLYVAFYSCAVFAPLTFIFARAAGTPGLVVIIASLTSWLLILFAAFYFNADIVRRATGAALLEEGLFPRLSSAAEDIAIASGQAAPRLMLIEDEAVNAFSMTSVRERQDMVFCTEGMARELHPDEVRAVMAHEMAHLQNGDAEIGSLIMSFSAIASFLFGPSSKMLRPLFRSVIITIIALAVLLLVPVVGHLLWSVVSSDIFATILLGLVLPPVALYLLGSIASLYWGFTLGKREYLADETAVEWTKYPEGMIDALLKAGKRDTRSCYAFLDNACFSPSGGARGMMDFQPSVLARIENIRKETYLPPI